MIKTAPNARRLNGCLNRMAPGLAVCLLALLLAVTIRLMAGDCPTFGHDPQSSPARRDSSSLPGGGDVVLQIVDSADG